MTGGERNSEELTKDILARFNERIEKSLKEKESSEEPLDVKVKSVYEKIGYILASYRSGKLPKALQVLPSIKSWERILVITDPGKWTPQAVLQVTKIFVSALPPSHAEIFLFKFLLPKVRKDFSDNKHVNPHIFMALKKAIYKPTAFYKGIVIPFCESEDISQKEAAILSSVLTKCPIPVYHSAAAIVFISKLQYSGPRAIVLRALIEKKYALPVSVVEALVYEFCKEVLNNVTMPVLWHQCLLSFTQLYKNDLSLEQRNNIKHLVAKQSHHSISSEILKELHFSDNKGSLA